MFIHFLNQVLEQKVRISPIISRIGALNSLFEVLEKHFIVPNKVTDGPKAEALIAKLEPESNQSVSSLNFGLPLGVRALAVDRKTLKWRAPFQTGGGTTRLVSPGWVIWANAPDRFEAGTPAISLIKYPRYSHVHPEFCTCVSLFDFKMLYI